MNYTISTPNIGKKDNVDSMRDEIAGFWVSTIMYIRKLSTRLIHILLHKHNQIERESVCVCVPEGRWSKMIHMYIFERIITFPFSVRYPKTNQCKSNSKQRSVCRNNVLVVQFAAAVADNLVVRPKIYILD